VISGINSHENLGDDVLYSGTVAAAIEGRFLALPAIAVSLVNRGNFHYETAAMVVLDFLRKSSEYSFPKRTVLNINVPDIPYEQLKGVKVTRLGHRAKGQDPQMISDPRGHQRFWIALAGEGDDAGEGTDFHAVSNNYVSVTPIHVDMTQYDVLNSMKTWLEE
jgi:5'-nucleotidase